MKLSMTWALDTIDEQICAIMFIMNPTWDGTERVRERRLWVEGRGEPRRIVGGEL